MAATLRDHGYTSCKADPDVWMKPKTKPCGFKYWSYILVYTDDILTIDHEPKQVMEYLASRYTLKPGSVQEPDTYLGSQISKFYIAGADRPEKPRWAMSSEKYVKQAVSDVELELDKVDLCLPTKVSTPLSQGYRPELDQSRELDGKRGQYYQSLIGVLRWIVSLVVSIFWSLCRCSQGMSSLPVRDTCNRSFICLRTSSTISDRRWSSTIPNHSSTTMLSKSVTGPNSMRMRRRRFRTTCRKHEVTES